MTDTVYRNGVEPTGNIIVTTGNEVVAYEVVEYLGVVRGVVVRSVNLGQGIVGGLKALAGGKIREFTDLCEAARHEAYRELLAHANDLGADGVIAMRYDATDFGQQAATEVLAYGTAVRLKRKG